MEEKIYFTEEDKELFKESFEDTLLYEFCDEEQIVVGIGVATGRRLVDLSYPTIKIRLDILKNVLENNGSPADVKKIILSL
jgi:hypothetical protein